MLVQKKFSRLNKSAGFTKTLNGPLYIKQSSNTYYDTSSKEAVNIFSIKPDELVYVDSFQVKRWFQW